MGAFDVRQYRDGKLIGGLRAPNTLHDEGCDYVLRRMFPVGGSFASARSDWQLCIGGINCLGFANTPNGTLDVPVPYDRLTSFAEITSVFANEGGAYGATHAFILGYARRPVTFTVSDHGRSALLTTEQREFANAIPWLPLGTYAPGEFKPPDFGWPAWKPEHRYPWDKPSWKADNWGDTGEAGAWSDMLTANPATAATFSVGVAFVISTSPTPILLCSAVFTRCLVIRPGDALWVRYAARVRSGTASSGAITTNQFARLIAKRAWGDDPAAIASNYRAVLATNPAGSLDQSATWSDITELSATGYAPLLLTDWAKGTQPFEVVGQCVGFENTGTETWPTVNWFCVVADVGGAPVLCWAEPINPPIALAAGDRITFPSGVTFALRDNHD